MVDDDSSVVEATVSLLESLGHTAVGFCSAEEFLASTHLGGTGCLILDVRMPGIGGFDLQRRLIRHGRDIPIIFVSAHGDNGISAEALRRRAVAFLRKPFSQDALLDAVHSIL